MIDVRTLLIKVIPVLVAAVIGAGITFFIMRGTGSSTATITVTNFTLISNAMPHFDPVDMANVPDPCKHLAELYNAVNRTYESFVNASPEYLYTISNCIIFSIEANRYKMCYQVDPAAEKIYWNIGGGYFASGGIAVCVGIEWIFLKADAVVMSGLPAAWKPDVGGMISFRAPF